MPGLGDYSVKIQGVLFWLAKVMSDFSGRPGLQMIYFDVCVSTILFVFFLSFFSYFFPSFSLPFSFLLLSSFLVSFFLSILALFVKNQLQKQEVSRGQSSVKGKEINRKKARNTG